MSTEPVYEMQLDGKPVMRGTWIECCKWIHDTRCFSFHYALKYAGYSLVEIS